MAILDSKPATDVPGDTMRRMVREHTDMDGRTWPAGTTFQPLSIGRDNTLGCDVQTVTIGGQRVAFSDRGKT